MSVQKIEIVKKSRKDQGKCRKCGVELPAGSGYLYWYPGFRSNYKIVRCLKPECYPRPSERETSKSASIMAAQESFEDDLLTLDSVEEIEQAVQEVGEAIRGVADEYQEALDQWENGNEQLQEKVDHYEEQAYELEDWQWDGDEEPEACDDHSDDGADDDCEACQEKREDWLEEIRDEARDAVHSVDFL